MLEVVAWQVRNAKCLLVLHSSPHDLQQIEESGAHEKGIHLQYLRVSFHHTVYCLRLPKTPSGHRGKRGELARREAQRDVPIRCCLMIPAVPWINKVAPPSWLNPDRRETVPG